MPHVQKDVKKAISQVHAERLVQSTARVIHHVTMLQVFVYQAVGMDSMVIIVT